MVKPRLAVTLGDPSGIGVEITLGAVNSLAVKSVSVPIIFGDEAFKHSFKNVEFITCSSIAKNLKMGVPSKRAGDIAYLSVQKAAQYCLEGKAQGLITAPVSKESFKKAGVKYLGHTELLASIAKSKKVVMMMVCGNICAVMVTRHIPLSLAAKKLTVKNIVETVRISADFLKKIDGKKIKIALCALNPHAGENSILGFEEKKIIFPAYKFLKKIGMDVAAPQSADAAWLKMKNGCYDLICGMYHDQVMIPLKCIDAKKIVNVTAGLPFIRTSPGHGTAFDIAGENIADHSAMEAALLYAAKNCF